jgi:hypothetical protein
MAAFTFQEKFDNAKEDRSIAVSSKNAIVKARADIKQEDYFNNTFLHGDTFTGYSGVNDLIWYWLKERSYEGGDIYFRPILGDSISQWRESYEEIMVAALADSGDSYPPPKWWWPFPVSDERYLNGFYPPDDNGVPGKELNWTTDYLNRNGDSRPGDSTWEYFSKGDSSGFLFHLYGLKTTVGYQPFSYGDSIVSDAIYGSQTAAIQAAKLFLYGTGDTYLGTQHGDTATGKGIIGRRKADLDISAIQPTSWAYVIGNGDSDQPTFYGDSIGDTNLFLSQIEYKTNFTTKLNDVCVFGDTGSSYVSHLKNLKSELALIEAGTNTLFADPDMASETGDSELNIDTLIDVFVRCIGDSGDTYYVGGDTTLWGTYNYFTGGSPPDGTEAEFDGALNLTKFLNDTVLVAVESRYTGLSDGTIIGDTGEAEGDFTLSRKWRTFWVKTRIAKPQSTLLSYNALFKSIADANRAIDNKNEQLITILGDTVWDHYQYIPTPKILASFYNPKLDQDDGSLIFKRITAVWDGQQHASKYIILRQLYTIASSTTVSNDPWGDTYYYDTISAIDPDTRFIVTEYDDKGRIAYAGDSIQTYQELFLYQHQLFSSNDLYGDTASNIILENKFLLFGDTAAYPLGSGDTRYVNPRTKTWSGLGDSNGVTGFWSNGVNLVKSPEVIITGDSFGYGDSNDDWYYDTNTISKLSSFYFNDNRFTKINSYASNADIKQRHLSGTFGDTLSKSFSGIFMKGDTGDTSSIYYLTLVGGMNFFLNINIYWYNQTTGLISGDTLSAEWFGDSIVRISAVSDPLNSIGDSHWLILKPQETTTGSFYATAIQLEENSFPTPYMGDSRNASVLGYTYTWGDSGAIETYIYPRFNFDEAQDKYIFGDLTSVTTRSIGSNYDQDTDRFKYSIFNVTGDTVVELYCGINTSGDSGDTAFVDNAYLKQWHHLKYYWKFYGDSITYGDTKIFKLFYNGVFVSGDSTGDSISFQNKLQIGGLPFYTSPAGYEFNGEITDFVIWDYGDTTTTHYDNQVPYFYPDPFPTGTNYLYRIQNIDVDTPVGNDTTKSLQSNMFESTEARTFTAISGDSVLELGDSHDYKKKEYVVVNGTSNSNGYYKLTRTEDTSIFITPTLGADTSGTVYPCTSVVFVQE